MIGSLIYEHNSAFHDHDHEHIVWHKILMDKFDQFLAIRQNFTI